MREGWFEDFSVGDEIRSPGKTITESEIIDWALTYDPQPFHMDKEAAAKHMYGGIIASGWMLGALSFRLFVMTNPFGEASLGSPGLEQLRWLAPVRPGDTIHVVVTVSDSRPSRSKPDRGIVTMDWAVRNQHDETVMTMQSIQLLLRRPSERS